MGNIHWDILIYDQNCKIACLAIFEIYHHYNHLNDRFVLSIFRLSQNLIVRTAYYVATDTQTDLIALFIYLLLPFSLLLNILVNVNNCIILL